MKSFKDYLKNKCVLTDGAMGTYFRQLYPKESRVAESFNMDAPEWIKSIHRSYIDAGAQLIRTNSFASNVQTLLGKPLREFKEWDQPLKVVYDNVYQSYQIAGAAAGDHSDLWIAGDIGPVPEQGMSNDEELLAQYETMADALIDAGAKIILFETFADYKYILPVIQYIKKQADIFVMVSFCLNKFGYTKTGLSAKSVLSTARDSGMIDSIGFNCGIGSAHMASILKKLDFGDMCISVVPNSGYPDLIQDRSVYQENVAYFCEHMKDIADLGANILGGCCGTNPEYIRKMAQMLGQRNAQLGERIHKKQTDASSGELCKERNDFLNKMISGQKVIAVELDPPFDGHDEKLVQSSALLKQAGVDLITLSDSPMGKMRSDSVLSAVRIQNQLDIPVMPHVACRDKNVIAMGASMMGAHMNGLRNILVVTGDPVPSGDRNVVSGVFDFNSIRLMNYIKQLNQEYFSDDPIVYGGALNYGRTYIDKEIERMHKKVEAGADYFLTQPIYSEEDIDRIRYIKSKVNTRILCGIMPLVSYRNAMFIKNEIYGINVPDAVVERYRPDMSRSEGEAAGIDIAVELIEKLKDVADGYYFMVPFNRASMICRILEQMDR